MKMQTKLSITALNTAVAEAEKKSREAASKPQPPPEKPRGIDEPTALERKQMAEISDNLRRSLPQIVKYGEIALNAMRMTGLDTKQIIVSLQAAVFIALRLDPEAVETYPIMQACLHSILDDDVRVMYEESKAHEMPDGAPPSAFPLGNIIVSKEVRDTCSEEGINLILIDHGQKRWGHASLKLCALNTKSIEKESGCVLSLWGEGDDQIVCVSAFKGERQVTKVMFLREDDIIQSMITAAEKKEMV